MRSVEKYILYQSVLGKIKIDFRTDFISCICPTTLLTSILTSI